MTVGIVYRVPGLGAVLGCDSRVTDEHGEIMTDSDEKWLVAGSAVACCAGALGGLGVDLRATPPRNWPELRKALTMTDAVDRGLDYEALVYDRRGDALFWSDHQGDALRRGLYATLGSGGATALGALDASAPPKTLEAAERLVRRALRITCKRHSACGGRLRVLVVPRRGTIRVG